MLIFFHKGEKVPLLYSEVIQEDGVWRTKDQYCSNGHQQIIFPYDSSMNGISSLIKVDLTDIPATSVVSKARLRFQAAVNSGMNSTFAEIFILTAEDQNAYLASCTPKTMDEQLHYGPIEWIVQQWKANQIYYTPDFGNLIAPIIATKSDSWRTYAYIVIKEKSEYTGPKSDRRAFSLDNNNEKQKPRIELEYFDKSPGKDHFHFMSV